MPLSANKSQSSLSLIIVASGELITGGTIPLHVLIPKCIRRYHNSGNHQVHHPVFPLALSLLNMVLKLTLSLLLMNHLRRLIRQIKVRLSYFLLTTKP